ncbi:MAG TPA: DUF4157 domain-containing protein, partial [Planctomycetota bacterium]|nr:DUF4157 domain-containing protein [Planctomycetota bacterium]
GAGQAGGTPASGPAPIPWQPPVERKGPQALPGLPLPADLRQKLEQEIDVDLARVRLFIGPEATAAAAGMGADAYAEGDDVVLGERAAAELSTGKAGTLAHELEHVRQHQKGETFGSKSPMAREILEEAAKEVEQKLPTFSRAIGASDFLTSPRTVERVAAGLPDEFATLRAPKDLGTVGIEHKDGEKDDEDELGGDPENVIHQLMWYYGVRPQIGEEEFLDELSERVMDLMQEELKIERERRHIEAPF